MCVTSAASLMKRTKEFAGTLPNGNHFLTYANKAESLVEGLNSMPIPIPTKNYKSIILHDSRAYGKELNDIAENFEVRDKSVSKGVLRSGTIEIQYVGNYAMVTGHISSIFEMCEVAGVEISESLGKFYIENYEGWSLVLPCWKGIVDVKNEPIHIEYPADIYPNDLYIYMMDGHDGQIPKNVERDTEHIICISLPDHKSGITDWNNKPFILPEFSSELLSVIPNLNRELFGYHINYDCPNGDLWINIKNPEYTLKDKFEKTLDNKDYTKFLFTPSKENSNF
jgi:hypothetical protein